MATYGQGPQQPQVVSSAAPIVPPPTQPSQTAPSTQVEDIGPIAKFQRLLPTLRQNLSNLMKVAGQVLQHNSSFDSANTLLYPELQPSHQKLEKCLEDFYSVCDQVEINLRLALEVRRQAHDSNKNTPTPVVNIKPDFQPPQPIEGHSYQHYTNIVRAQINCAKEVHDILHKFAVNLDK